MDKGNARVFAEMSRLYFARASEGGSDADYGLSWKAANHAVELDPGLADAHQALGWFSMTKNWDWTAADASFKRALALEPHNVRALRSAAALAGAVGRFDEAITLGQRAAELEPTNAQIYYNLCILQRKGGQPDGALLSGRRALELDPGLSNVHFQLGAVYLAKGNVTEAIREFEQESDAAFKARGLAMAYYSAGRMSESEPVSGNADCRPSERCRAGDRAGVRLAQREGQGVRVARPRLCPAGLGVGRVEGGTAVPQPLPRSAVDGVPHREAEVGPIDFG